MSPLRTTGATNAGSTGKWLLCDVCGRVNQCTVQGIPVTGPMGRLPQSTLMELVSITGSGSWGSFVVVNWPSAVDGCEPNCCTQYTRLTCQPRHNLHLSTYSSTAMTALQPVATCRQSPYFQPVPAATKPAILIMMSFAPRRHLTGTAFNIWKYAACHLQLIIIAWLS